jgi:uncharacterized protein YqeY|tara:strand:+ start:169 stop:618 length:450 start_codon:yes stop_codon:yes gene_type:complete
MPDLKSQVLADVKSAMKSGEKEILGVLRLISAAFKQHEVDKREDVGDETAVIILTRMSKQRRESITQFEAGNRDDLARQEKLELDIIQKYLPTQLSEDEMIKKVESAIHEANATTMSDMGKVMGLLRNLTGRADMSSISALVKKKLSSQ